MVKIFDENKVWSESTFQSAFSKYYDFSQLAPGIYNVELYSNNELLDKMEMDLRRSEAKPVVYSKLEKVEFNKFKLLVNSILESDMSVMVYENDRLIYEETFENVSGFHKLTK